MKLFSKLKNDNPVPSGSFCPSFKLGTSWGWCLHSFFFPQRGCFFFCEYAGHILYIIQPTCYTCRSHPKNSTSIPCNYLPQFLLTCASYNFQQCTALSCIIIIILFWCNISQFSVMHLGQLPHVPKFNMLVSLHVLCMWHAHVTKTRATESFHTTSQYVHCLRRSLLTSAVSHPYTRYSGIVLWGVGPFVWSKKGHSVFTTFVNCPIVCA